MSGIRFDVHLDQADDGTVTLTQPLLGLQPYVLIEFDTDDEGLVVEVRIGGPQQDVTQIGTILKMLGASLEAQAETLTAQAYANAEAGGEQTAKTNFPLGDLGLGR